MNKKLASLVLIAVLSLTGLLAQAQGTTGEETSPRIVARFAGLEDFASPGDKLPAQINILGLSHSINAPGKSSENKPLESAPIYSNRLMLTKPVDSLTAPLLKAAETRKPIKSLAVDMTTPGATLRYSLESVIIEDISYSLYSNDPGGGIQGQETVNLSAAKMTVAFVKGSQHSTVTLDKPKHAP